MRTAALLARVKRLESRRSGEFRLLEVFLDSIYGMTPEEREATLAAARARWPRGTTLEQFVVSSFEERGDAS